VRLDRYFTLSVFRRLCSAGFSGGDRQLPILMYHSISNETEEDIQPYYRLATSPTRFAEQMQWLADSGYAGVSLEQALATSVMVKGRNNKCVAITFDDGFRDFYTAAWPVLRRFGFSATMYLPTAFLANDRKMFRDKDCMTWNEVRELRSNGIQFGSHTVNHPKLHELSWKTIEKELTLSKAIIEHELQEEISTFAYPYAFPQEDLKFTTTLSALLRKTGYQTCATTVIGRAQMADDPYCLKRLPANSCDDRALFLAKLDGAYDWLGSAQRTVRKLKRLAGKTVRREVDPVPA
jgi:peptidoglycan/xylan/chitin deacetylase (PgdA/CDA1 family)